MCDMACFLLIMTSYSVSSHDHRTEIKKCLAQNFPVSRSSEIHVYESLGFYLLCISIFLHPPQPMSKQVKLELLKYSGILLSPTRCHVRLQLNFPCQKDYIKHCYWANCRDSSFKRMQIFSFPLPSLPVWDFILSKMQKPSAGPLEKPVHFFFSQHCIQV